jgi:hypothetical protein
MLKALENYFSPVTDLIKKIRGYLSDRILITDLIAKLIITFGVVLIVGGLYLMITNGGASTQIAQNIAVKSVVSTVDWIPGIPFLIGDLANFSASTVGLVCWFFGVDLLLLGLGIWVRHVFARVTTLMIFFLAACFQLVQFMYFGIIGSPTSIVELLVDGVFVYFLVSRFDAKKNLPLSGSRI